MIRVMLIIALSVAAGLVIRNAFHKDPPAPLARSASSADVAKELRDLSGAAAPEKLWARDFAAFASMHHGQWIVGQCQQPCLSEAEAAAQAHSNAARFVWPIVLSRFSNVPSDADWLRGRVEADATAGRLDADKLAEKFDRPYGAVWTESVLVDISPVRIDPLMNSYKSDRIALRHRQARGHQTLLILVIGAWLVYAIMNAVTKGYFTVRLRLAAAVATALGVALLV